ncbi:MAG: LapA family protein [Rhodocyclaceae bacterium]|nr:LapA family protein [Rhodocyclaceae bacterium]
MQLITIFAMLVAAGGVTFALQNNVPVALTFLLWRFDSSLAMVVLLALAVGGFIVALVSTPSTLRRQWALARQTARIAALEKTCGAQRETIAALEGRLAAAVATTVVERPYLGLKQIIARIGDGEKRAPPADV